VDGGCQKLIGSLRAALWQRGRGEDAVRFVYHVSQCAEIVAASCHAATIAARKRNCNRLLFFINASLGHYPRRELLGTLLLLALYGLIATAWVRRTRDRDRQSHWRSTLFFIGLVALSLSLANLSAEFIYRYVTGHKLGLTPAIGIWVNVNAMACLVAGIFCLVGKGRGRFVSFLAMPLLIFFWGIHFAV